MTNFHARVSVLFFTISRYVDLRVDFSVANPSGYLSLRSELSDFEISSEVFVDPAKSKRVCLTQYGVALELASGLETVLQVIVFRNFLSIKPLVNAFVNPF